MNSVLLVISIIIAVLPGFVALGNILHATCFVVPHVFLLASFAVVYGWKDVLFLRTPHYWRQLALHCLIGFMAVISW